MAMAEPMLSLTVGHLRLPFLIDTGATYSAINSQLPPDMMSSNYLSGYSGDSMTLPKTKLLVVCNGSQTVTHTHLLLNGVVDLFNQWRPWISLMEPYGPPPEPPHLTLYYDPSADLPYYDMFQSELQDAVWEVFSPGIYVGPEGVAALITFTLDAVGAAHLELPHWTETGYLTSTGKPVKHKEELLALERAIQLPKQVAIVKCKGHQKENSLVERGNEAADKVRSKGKPETDAPPEVALSEWVYLKVIKRKWCEPRWTGPYRVGERISYAERLNGKGPAWYHLSQCRPAHPSKAEESPPNGAE
ncbi:hypothetical protein MHYP_G00309220 [Metynnis hypsauchen]